MAKTTPLKRLRESRGLSQSEAAERIGIDQATLSRIENGKAQPPDAAEKIAKYFKGAINEIQILYPHRRSTQ